MQNYIFIWQTRIKFHTDSHGRWGLYYKQSYRFTWQMRITLCTELQIYITDEDKMTYRAIELHGRWRQSLRPKATNVCFIQSSLTHQTGHIKITISSLSKSIIHSLGGPFPVRPLFTCKTAVHVLIESSAEKPVRFISKPISTNEDSIWYRVQCVFYT